jgi:hypothetical protein
VLVGGLFFLAFWTKQNALVAIAVMVLYCLVHRRGAERILLPVTVLGLLVVTSVILHIATDGWYTFYVFELAPQRPMDKSLILGFWAREMLPVMFPALLFTAGYVVERLRKGQLRAAAVNLCFIVGLLGASWIARVHAGGYANTLMPVLAALSLGLGLGLAVLRLDLTEPGSHAQSAGSDQFWDRMILAGLAVLLGLVQFSRLRYDAGSQLPSASDEQAGDHCLSQIAAMRSDVFVPFHGYMAARVGKPRHAHLMAMGDVMRGRDEGKKAALRSSVVERFTSGSIKTVIYDAWWEFEPVARGYFTFQRNMFSEPGVFLPVTGAQVRPDSIFVLKSPAVGPAVAD